MKTEQRYVLQLAGAALRGEPFVWQDALPDAERVVRTLVHWNLALVAQAAREPDAFLKTVAEHPALEKQRREMLFRSMQREHCWQALIEAAGREGVDLLAFKGIVTCRLYPEPQMRPMGDIDLLVRPEQVPAMRRAAEAVGVARYQTGLKHDHILFDGGVHAEMHSAIVDPMTEYGSYYRSVWDRAVPVPGHEHLYTLSAEDHFIFTLVHMREHARRGEFALRMATDVYLMRAKPMDADYVRGELAALGLTTFAANIDHILTGWFTGTLSEDDPCRPLSDYLLGERTFGDAQAGDDAARYGSRFRFYVCRAFPPYRQMQTMFGWLRGRPLLLPAAWGLRFVSAFGKGAVVRNIWKSGKRINPETVTQGELQSRFFSEYGL